MGLTMIPMHTGKKSHANNALILLKFSSPPPVQWSLEERGSIFFGNAFKSDVQGRGSLGKADTFGCLSTLLAPAPGMGHEPIPLDSNWFGWWHGCNSSQ